MLVLEFHVRQDRDGTLWTLNHGEQPSAPYYFQDGEEVARTFYMLGRAGKEDELRKQWAEQLAILDRVQKEKVIKDGKTV